MGGRVVPAETQLVTEGCRIPAIKLVCCAVYGIGAVSELLRCQPLSCSALFCLQNSKKEWIPAAVGYWDKEYNNEPEPPAVGIDARLRFVWQRRCGKHWAEMTAQGANKSGSWVHCIYCDSKENLPKGWMEPSEYAAQAARMLGELAVVERIFTECKVLGGTYGGFDFSLALRPSQPGQERRRLEVEVDGPQHFTKAMHDTTAQQQRESDCCKNEEAWKQGRCVVRLHYLDCWRWKPVLQEAIRLAMLPSRKRFILWSVSYARLRRIGEWKVSKAGSCTYLVLDGVVVAGGKGKDVQPDQPSCITDCQDVVNV